MSQRSAAILIISVVIAISVIGGWFLFARQKMAPDSDRSAGWKVYHNESYGFEFRYPREMLVRDGGGGISQTDVLLYLCQNPTCLTIPITIMTDHDLFVKVTQQTLERLLYPNRRIIRQSRMELGALSITEAAFDTGVTWLILTDGDQKLILEVHREFNIALARAISRTFTIHK